MTTAINAPNLKPVTHWRKSVLRGETYGVVEARVAPCIVPPPTDFDEAIDGEHRPSFRDLADWLRSNPDSNSDQLRGTLGSQCLVAAFWQARTGRLYYLRYEWITQGIRLDVEYNGAYPVVPDPAGRRRPLTIVEEVAARLYDNELTARASRLRKRGAERVAKRLELMSVIIDDPDTRLLDVIDGRMATRSSQFLLKWGGALGDLGVPLMPSSA